MEKKKTKKGKYKSPRKEHYVFDRMCLAVAKYIESMGGSAVVVGNVGIYQDAGAAKFNYNLVLRITGKMPTKRNV